jgi:hypothetical protein
MSTITVRAVDRAGHPAIASVGYSVTQPLSSKVGLGVYASGNNPWVTAPGNSAVALNLGSGYLPYTGRISKSAGLMNAWNHGLDLVVAVDSKDGSGVFAAWDSFANGAHDSDWNGILDDAVALLKARPRQKIRLAPVHEQNLRIGKKKCNPADQPGDYVPLANHFADLVNGRGNARLMPGHWTASFSATYLPDKAKMKWGSGDPYKVGTDPVSSTAADQFRPVVTSFRNAGWTAQDMLITETGIKTDVFSNGGRFDVPTQQKYYASIPAAIATLGLAGVVWFRANSGDHDYIPTDPSVDASFGAMAAALLT